MGEGAVAAAGRRAAGGDLDVEIRTIGVDEIIPGKNPRVDLKPGDAAYDALEKSVERWSMVQPLVWNQQTGHLVGGNQRLKVLVAKGATEVTVSVVDMTEDEEVALGIALNKIEGDWDKQKLFEALNDLPFDLSITGFDAVGMSALADDLAREAALFVPNFEPVVPEIVAAPVTQQQLDKVAGKQTEKFVAADIKTVSCPHCGGSFGVKKSLYGK